MHRRQLIRTLPAAALLPLAGAGSSAFADTWPARPVRLVVTQGTGSGSDVIGRLIAGKLGEQLGQSVFVENRVGGSGIIGHQWVLGQPADGYTLLLSTTAPLAVVPATNRNARYKLADFTIVAPAIRSPFMVLVNTQPGSPQTLQDLTKRLKAEPASFSSSGTGTMTHLASEMYLQQVEARATHVPYKGSGQSLADLVSGQVLFSTDSPTAAGSLVRGGRLRVLAVTAERRLDSYPDAPTMAELGYPGLTISTMGGLFGPPDMPAPVVERIAREMAVVMKSPDVARTLAAQDTEALTMPLASFREQMRQGASRLEQVVARLGLVIE